MGEVVEQPQEMILQHARDLLERLEFAACDGIEPLFEEGGAALGTVLFPELGEGLLVRPGARRLQVTLAQLVKGELAVALRQRVLQPQVLRAFETVVTALQQASMFLAS